MSPAPSLSLPRCRPVPPRKGAVLCALDLGAHKVACLIARLDPMEERRSLAGRTHLVRVLGLGHHRAEGVKGGAVVDLAAAEAAVAAAVDAAERMAKVEVRSLLVSLGGGRLASQARQGTVPVAGALVTEGDARRALARAGTLAGPGRVALHALPGGFALDGTPVEEPRGLAGAELTARVHVVSAEEATARNLLLAVERTHLDVEGVVAAPYAAGLATLVDDEAEIGAVVIDMGAWLTGLALFEGGRLVHADAVAVGGRHVTLDVARGLDTSFAAAERLKTLYGSTLAASSDERETVSVPRAGDEEGGATSVPRSALVGVIRPRVEEILELVRDRLRAAGIEPATRRVVLTGGSSQLTGLGDLAARVLSKHVRIGRPLGVKGLPEAAKGPAFAAAVGLLVYPQAAGAEISPAAPSPVGEGDGAIARLGRWFGRSF